MPIENIISSQSWECPAGVSVVTVECWGAGGAGGGTGGGLHEESTASSGGGGAGGSYIRKDVPVTPGVFYDIEVGLGGVGTEFAGGSGGASHFDSYSVANAVGGQGGGITSYPGYNHSAGVGTILGCVGDIMRKGGDGSRGSWEFSYSGGGGGAAAFTSNGNNATTRYGGSPISPYSGGGADGVTTPIAGSVGEDYGGGGSGGLVFPSSTTRKAGGDGGDGLVVLTYEVGGTVEISSSLNTESVMTSSLTLSSTISINSELTAESRLLASLTITTPSYASNDIKVGNIKLTINDVIEKWWKLNYYLGGELLPPVHDYGKLYNWFAVDDIRGLAPEGWHVTTAAEWAALAVAWSGVPSGLSHYNVTTYFKSTGHLLNGSGLWRYYNDSVLGNNNSGLNIEPCGVIGASGAKNGRSDYSNFWMSDSRSLLLGRYKNFSYNGTSLYENAGYYAKQYGFNVRCIKDSAVGWDDSMTLEDIDGNQYSAKLMLDGKVWMTQNLKVGKYKDGTVIPIVDDPIVWSALVTGAIGTYTI